MVLPIVGEFDIQAAQQYLAANTQVLAAYLFGSVAQGKANKLSDVDIAVLLPSDYTEEAQIECQLLLMRDFEQYSDRDVQIVVLNRAPLILSFQVIQDGVLFYEGHRDQRIEFEVRTRRLYFDFKPRLDSINKVLMNRIREAGLGSRKRGTTRTLEAAQRIHQRLKRASER